MEVGHMIAVAVPVGLFLAGIVYGIVRWTIAHHVGRVAAAHTAIIQLREDMAKRPTQEEIDMDVSKITGQLDAMRREAQERAEKLLAAMEANRKEARGDTESLRADLGSVHRRIDTVMLARPGA